MVPCSAYEGASNGCTTVTTTNGDVVSARKRTAAETANLASISYNKYGFFAFGFGGGSLYIKIIDVYQGVDRPIEVLL